MFPRAREILFQDIAALFSCFLPILLFWNDLSVPICRSKISLPFSHPVVDMASAILPLIVCSFLLFCNFLFFFYIVWSSIDIFLEFLLLHRFLVRALNPFLVTVAVLFQFPRNISKYSVFLFSSLLTWYFYQRFKSKFSPGFLTLFFGLRGDPDFFTD